MKDTILRYALKNALDFGGKVNAKVVLGQVLKEHPDLKKDVPGLMKKIDAVIRDIERLPEQGQRKKLNALAPELLGKEEAKETKHEGPLKPLPNAVKGEVVVRIAPSPSGPLHIGHAYGASLNYEYARMYGGKLILRIEDTNPENIYEPAYQLIEEDVRWFTENNLAEVIVQSSRLGIYYDHAETLVEQGDAYVCTCNPDRWRTLKNSGNACPCRNIQSQEQQVRYAKMFSEYAEGEAVLRLKTDIQHKNPAMRDFAIMRVNEHVHPRTGTAQRVWPLMVFAVAVDDHTLGITHVINGKDHLDNAAKERQIMKLLGWSTPEYSHWGLIHFEGLRLSSSETRIAIEQHEYTGWNDPRLPFLPALRQRGYQPEAFRRYALEIGLSMNDKKVSREEFWKQINAFNREIIEPVANRYFFVDSPILITVDGLTRKTIKMSLHPSFPKRGTRTITTTHEVYIAMSDFKKLGEGYVHRLMDCCNFKVEGKKIVYVSDAYEDYKDAPRKGMIIHWVPASAKVDVKVLMDNGAVVEGYGESGMQNLKEGDIIQLERRYFVRADKTEKNKIECWYLHT